MDQYIIDRTEYLLSTSRGGEIEKYLIDHADTIGSFVILDDDSDDDMHLRFPDQFVHCENIFGGYLYEGTKAKLLNFDLAEIDKAGTAFRSFTENSPRQRDFSLTPYTISLIKRKERINVWKSLYLDFIKAILGSDYLHSLEIIRIYDDSKQYYLLKDLEAFLAKVLKRNKTIKRLKINVRQGHLFDEEKFFESIFNRDHPLELLDLTHCYVSSKEKIMIAARVKYINNPITINISDTGYWSEWLVENSTVTGKVTLIISDDMRQFFPSPLPENIKYAEQPSDFRRIVLA